MIVWAMESNMMSILTDCPHRERLGWLEEDYLMVMLIDIISIGLTLF